MGLMGLGRHFSLQALWTKPTVRKLSQWSKPQGEILSNGVSLSKTVCLSQRAKPLAAQGKVFGLFLGNASKQLSFEKGP